MSPTPCSQFMMTLNGKNIKSAGGYLWSLAGWQVIMQPERGINIRGNGDPLYIHSVHVAHLLLKVIQVLILHISCHVLRGRARCQPLKRPNKTISKLFIDQHSLTCSYPMFSRPPLLQMICDARHVSDLDRRSHIMGIAMIHTQTPPDITPWNKWLRQ